MFRGLEIGGGDHPRAPANFEQFDMYAWTELASYKKVHIGDARDLSRFEDETFDTILSSQTLEHFGRNETVHILREWVRVLKPGGVLHLFLPDIQGMYLDYLHGVTTWDMFIERVYGTQDYEGNTHYTMFTRKEFVKFINKYFFEELRINSIYPIANDGGFEIYCLKVS